MAQIEVVLAIRDYNGNEYEELKKLFEGSVFPYTLCGNPLTFTPVLNSKERIINRKNETDLKFNDIQVKLIAEIPAEIDIENNYIHYYNGSRDLSAEDITVKKLHKYFKHDTLDDQFEGELEVFCQKMTQAVFLAKPDASLETAQCTIYLDHVRFREKRFIDNLVQEEVYEEYSNLFKTDLNIGKTWEWLVRNGVTATGEASCPVVPILSYIFNREYHEVLFYSVIGLEALYGNGKNNRGIKYTLQNRIHAVFSDITTDQIGNLYAARSEFAHGNGEIGSCNLVSYLIHHREKYRDKAILSCAILFESIRLLIANNAARFTFQESLDVQVGFDQ